MVSVKICLCFVIVVLNQMNAASGECQVAVTKFMHLFH